MARWGEILEAEPAFVARVRASFDSHVHKTIATLRRDGSPRISGIELILAEGDAWVGSMPDAVKALDLQRDSRYAIHSASGEGETWIGDGKFSGRAEEVSDQAVLDAVMRAASPEAKEAGHQIGSMHLFRLEIEEMVWTGLDEERSKLVIESWAPARGLRRIER